jgi:hypothetical protein
MAVNCLFLFRSVAGRRVIRVSKVHFLTFILKYVILELSFYRGNYMSGLTDEQLELYSKLQNTIGSQGNIADILQEVSKDDLFVVLATKGTTIKFKNGERKTGNLLEYAAFIKNQEGLKAILKR